MLSELKIKMLPLALENVLVVLLTQKLPGRTFL